MAHPRPGLDQCSGQVGRLLAGMGLFQACSIVSGLAQSRALADRKMRCSCHATPCSSTTVIALVVLAPSTSSALLRHKWVGSHTSASEHRSCSFEEERLSGRGRARFVPDVSGGLRLCCRIYSCFCCSCAEPGLSLVVVPSGHRTAFLISSRLVGSMAWSLTMAFFAFPFGSVQASGSQQLLGRGPQARVGT